MEHIINQHSFTSGVISPDLVFRVDTAEYRKGALKEGTNIQVDLKGGIRKRNGTKFINVLADQNEIGKKIKYQYSSTDAFILEFRDERLTFSNKNGQIIEASKNISAITNATLGEITSTAHGFSDGDLIYITGVVGMTEINSATLPYEVANKTTDTFNVIPHPLTNGVMPDPPLNTTTFGTFSSSQKRPNSFFGTFSMLSKRPN